jgi:hypothetical protein
MLNTINWSKSQHEILCILGYTKKTKSDILYSEQYTFQHYNSVTFCHFRVAYYTKYFMLRLCTICRVQHCLPLNFCFRIIWNF